MSPTTHLQLKGVKVYLALFLGLWGLTLLAATLFSSFIASWIQGHFLIVLFLAFCCLIASVLIFLKAPQYEKTYKVSHVEGLEISLTPEAVIDAITPLFDKLCSGKEVKKDVLFHKGSVHIFIDLPYHPQDQQKELLESIENSLKEVLRRIFGYTSDFLLVTSFQEPSS